MDNLIKRVDIEKSKDNNIFITHYFPIRFFFFCQYPDGKQLQQINAIRKKGWQIQDSKTDYITYK